MTHAHVPLWQYPGNANLARDWSRIKVSYPSVSWVCVNVSSGPGNAQDSRFVTQIPLIQADGIKVIGYVNSAFAANSLATVEADIDKWYTWYPSLDGIFLDEINLDVSNHVYYSTLYTYTKAKAATVLSVINCYRIPDSTYIDCADKFVIFEGTAATFINSYADATWIHSNPASMFAAMITSNSPACMHQCLPLLTQRNIGYAYFSNGTYTVNAYSHMPDINYWNTEKLLLNS